MLVPVEGTPYVKDTKTNALLTVNRTAIEQNEARKRLSNSLNTKAEDINNMKTQIAGLNQDLSEIKQMLKHLMLREK
jgi:N-methylhydantoinase B/oxoprolinase/acetone carboxylase alpha subunit